MSTPSSLPAWAAEIASLYESHAASQFVLHGNVHDSLLLPGIGEPRLGKLDEYVLEVLIPQFEVVLTYDLGGGLRVVRGQQTFAAWPSAPTQGSAMPRAPREAIDLLTHYARYASNVRRANGASTRIAFLLRDAHLAIPSLQGGLNYDLNAIALQVKTWANETLLIEHPFATFLFTENLNDLHPLISRDPRSANIRVPLPPPAQLAETFRRLAPAGLSTDFTAYMGTRACRYVNKTLALAGAMAFTGIVNCFAIVVTLAFINAITVYVVHNTVRRTVCGFVSRAADHACRRQCQCCTGCQCGTF